MSLRITAALLLALVVALPATAQTATPDEARTIAKQAYIYGFPMVDSYRIQYAYFVDPRNPEYKGAWNVPHSTSRVYTPADTAVQTPNSDTPYTAIGLDLRSEPVVLTVPPIENNRYFSIQFIDMYTYNFAYVGSRATGNDGGNFLVAGPGWKGETPKGITKVIRSETELAMALYRTQLLNPGDLENVKAIQAQYKAQPLSAFLGNAAPKAAPRIDFPKPLSSQDERSSLEVFKLMNFLMQFTPPNPGEKELLASFAKIGVGAGKPFDVAALSPEMNTALSQGIADAWQDMAALQKQIAAGQVTSGQLFGTREHLQGDYLYRMAAAVLGIYGNSAEEAMYPIYSVDSDNQKLDGANRYTIHFAKDQLPPAQAFWSLTMYEMPKSLLVANPLNRYLLNSSMLPDLVKDADGGLTLYVQHESPGKDKEANWLPAPAGPFQIVMRLYWPEPKALDGSWKHPPIVQVK